MTIRTGIFLGLLFLVGGELRADQVEMQNGDRYAGKVIAMTADTIVLQSDVLGKLTLSRSKVAKINLGASAAPPVAQFTNQAHVAPTNASVDIATAMRDVGAYTNLVEQVRKQFLNEAGPEANNKYDELVAGLLGGKFDMNNLRAEAKAAADKIKALKRQGGDVGEPLNSYLAILDNFLKQTAPSIPSPTTATNSASGVSISR